MSGLNFKLKEPERVAREDGTQGAGGLEHWKAPNSYIRAYHYPFCCTGVVLANLGGSDDSYGENEDLDDVIHHLRAWMDYLRDHTLITWKSFISVCTTEEQEMANEALEELGFIPHYMGNKHNDYDLITWHYDFAAEE